MKRNPKRTLLAWLLTAAMLLSLLPTVALAADTVDSGTCGDNLTWILDEDGVLTISGTGKMTSYSTTSTAPWYASRTSITSAVLEDGVTSVGNYAFYGCTNLTDITLPDSLTSIGDGAFYYCSKLTGVAIPSNVTSIGDYAFYGCSSLTEITIPEGITKIGSSAFCSVFYGCSSLTNVTIPDGVTSIGHNAFYGCTSLTNIAIPDSVTSIGNYAFQGCTSLSSITIPDGVTSIGSYAFRDCSSLTSITIPDSVTSIGSWVFRDCTSLTSINIPNVTAIESGTFSGCTHLTSVTIPDGIASIGDYAFYNCRALISVYYAGSESDWAAISIGSGNSSLTSATIYCTYYATFDWSEDFESCTATVLKIGTGETQVVECAVAVETTDPATCTTNGKTVYKATCSIDGFSFSDTATETIPAAGSHSWSDWTVPSGQTDLAQRTCTVCGEVEEQELDDIVCVGQSAKFTLTSSYDQSYTVADADGTVLSATLYSSSSSVVSIGSYTSGTYSKSYKVVISEPGLHILTITGSVSGTQTYALMVVNHSYTAKTVAPTCTEQGYTIYTCSVCGDSYTENVIAATGHTQGDPVIENETAATCTTDASYDTVVYCTVCGEELSRETTITAPATGHTAVETVIENEAAATCTKGGSYDTVVYCIVCGEEISRETVTVDATGHNYTSEVTKAATCGEDGVMTYTCTVCGETKTESIPATGNHTWNNGTVTTAATCTTEGVRTYTCTVCGATKTESIPATGNHTWNNGEVTTPATHSTTGVMTYTCTVCGATKTETIAKATFLFDDVKDSSVYYYDAVYWAYDSGITTGTSDTLFSPSADCTRAQFVTFLYRLAGSPTPTTTSCKFTDISASGYYYKAVLWAAANGVTEGTTSTTFSPNVKITRAQAVTMIYRYAGSPSVSTTNPFTDTSSSAYYYNAMLWAVKNGITSGTSKTTFSPNTTCSRAMMVTFLYRYANA